MKAYGKKLVCMAIGSMCGIALFAQSNVLASNEGANQDKTITVKNSSEKSIAVFAGPREGIRDPKLKTFGGLSSNTVYVVPNDVVCLMSADKKPIACAIVKSETTIVEINTSATAVTGR